MRAVVATRFGGPEVLTVSEVPDPVPGPGEVVVDVAAADVLFLDTQLRRRGGGPYFTVTPPYVPGGGVAGRVTATGPGAGDGWLGRAVAARTGNTGGYAQRAAAPVAGLTAVPAGLGLAEAAALLHDGMTAQRLLASAPVKPDDWVLVTAAAGGMGLLLVQSLRAAGARVVAAARGDRKLDAVRRQGADAVVDYSLPGWPSQVREITGPAGAQVVLDGAGGQIGEAAYALTADGGWFSGHGAPSGDFAFAQIDREDAARRGIEVRGIQDLQLDPARAAGLTARVLAAAAAGQLTPVIGQTFPLADAAAAHAAIEGRTALGKTLLLP